MTTGSQHSNNAAREGQATASAQWAPLPAGVFCPDCGYDLRGLASNHCPECGFGLEPARTPEPQIPWVYRRQVGYLRAYWRTVAAATFRPQRFCLEILRPVSYRDGQCFRWVTIAHAYVAVLVAGLATFAHRDPGNPLDRNRIPWFSLTAACGLLELLALTGLTSYAFHPRRLPNELQNRAVALSYYGWAPLAYAPLALVFFVPGILLYVEEDRGGLLIGAALVGASSLLCGWATVDRYAKRLLHESPQQSLWRRLRWLAASAGATFVILLLLPATVIYLLLVIDSLR